MHIRDPVPISQAVYKSAMGKVQSKVLSIGTLAYWCALYVRIAVQGRERAY